MYLAAIGKTANTRYEIRQSYLDGDHYRYRLVFDLGRRPADYIEHVTDDICYFSAELERSVELASGRDPTLILEELLFDFLPAEQRFRLKRFPHRTKIRLRALSSQDRKAIDKEIHLFDRRRLYYLRYGAVDQSRIFRLNPKLYRPLLGQCRDEREYYFMDLEKALHTHELRTYVFAVFDVQRHFSQSFSATMPEALNQVDIADHFVADICRLNDDSSFWADTTGNASLHDHLTRYLFMFFDHGYGRRALFDDFLREFMGRHRAFTRPPQRPTVRADEAATIFATDQQRLQTMDKKELTRLYRLRAKQLHPDSGGEHEQFVKLQAAYASLLIRKK